MDYEVFDRAIRSRALFVVEQLSKTRPQEIVIITLLAVSIGIGAAILINQRKIKKQLRELLDQKEDKPNGETSVSDTE